MIRELQGEDKPQIRQIVQAIIAKQGLLAGFYWPQDLLESELRNLRGVGYFNPGLAAFVIYRDLPGARDISIVASHPASHRSGYVLELLKFLSKTEVDLWLEVHEENIAAQKLYERAGFILTGRRPRYYKDDGTALLYSLKAL